MRKVAMYLFYSLVVEIKSFIYVQSSKTEEKFPKIYVLTA